MRMHPEYQYLNLLDRLLRAPARKTRNDTATRSLFGASMVFDMADGFPLLTTKRVPFKAVALELDWFLSGNTNAKWLEDRGVNIWREWGDPETREMGPIYGQQFRGQLAVDGKTDHNGESYEWSYEIDVLSDVIDGIKNDPYSRRHVISLWQANQLEGMALPPCHGIAIQFYVEADERLSCSMYQRSADAFLGLPFNIASYSLLLHYVSTAVGREPGKFHWFGGDFHLYSNHEEAAREQLSREPKRFPGLCIDETWNHPEWERVNELVPDYQHCTLIGYDPHPTIKAGVSA